MRKKGNLPFATTWMEPEGIVSEIKSDEKDKYCYDIYLYVESKKAKLIATKTRTVVTRG